MLFGGSGISRAQQAWTIAGLAILVLVAIVAFPNIQAIYRAEGDFIVGSLFSLAGFAFAKATSRAQEDKALELIRTAPTPRVLNVLEKEADARLRASGAHDHLAVIQRNIDVAMERLSEYYDGEARNLDFYRHSPLLRATLDELDRTSREIFALRRILNSFTDRPDYALPEEERQKLVAGLRHLREAVGRRNQVYENLSRRADFREAQGILDILAVMTSDMLKAERRLNEILDRHLTLVPVDALQMTIGYLSAGRNRAEEFRSMLQVRGLEIPATFPVMVADLQNSLESITVTLRTLRSTGPDGN